MVLRRFAGLLLVSGALAAGLASTAHAVSEPPRQSVTDPSVLQIDESRYLGNRLRAETVLTDEQGKDFRVGDLLGKPLILLLSYYGCDGTCPTMNRELASVITRVERFKPGRDYRVLTVSFDARDTPEQAGKFLVQAAGVPEALQGIEGGWRHAIVKTGDVQGFAGEVGFRFFWSDAAKAFMHPNVLVFLTPEGRVARYIYGTRMDAQAIRLALIDADWERISESSAVFDMMTGACYSYNYAEGRYQWNYSLLAGVGSLVFGVTLMLLGAWLYRRKMKRRTQVGQGNQGILQGDRHA